nr:hypothetical protein [Halorubrum sp. Atlit-26R]
MSLETAVPASAVAPASTPRAPSRGGSHRRPPGEPADRNPDDSQQVGIERRRERDRGKSGDDRGHRREAEEPEPLSEPVAERPPERGLGRRERLVEDEPEGDGTRGQDGYHEDSAEGESGQQRGVELRDALDARADDAFGTRRDRLGFDRGDPVPGADAAGGHAERRGRRAGRSGAPAGHHER